MIPIRPNDFVPIFYFSSENLKVKAMETSKAEKKHKKEKKSKKEKHKKSSKHKKEKRKKKHHSCSDSDENTKNSDGIRTPKLPTPPPTTINLDDDLSADEIKESKEIFSKFVGKRDNHENGGAAVKRPKLIPTDPDELVNIIKKTIDKVQPTVVSSASDSEG